MSVDVIKDFRFALDDYIERKIEYQQARDAFGNNYDWDYYGSRDIALMREAEERFDSALEAAISGLVGQ